MQGRRFEDRGKGKFWEIFWEADEAETVTGTIGTKGRASRHALGSIAATIAFVDGEVSQRVAQGFVEVIPETADAAPQAPPAPHFMAQIAEAYDDDAPRLVYADWLQQHGDPLGEFIMMQCERARLDRWDERQKAMREREEHAVTLYRRRWLPGLESANVEWERGFVERIRLSHPPDVYLYHRILEAAPLARTLSVTAVSAFDVGARLDLEPLSLSQLTGLYIRGYGGVDAGKLVDLCERNNIDRFGLRVCSLSGRALEPIATRGWRRLDLEGNALGLRGVQAVIASATTLEELELGSAGITEAGVLALANTSFPRLRRLGLGRLGLTAKSLVPLARSTGFPALRAIDLDRNTLDAASIAALGTTAWPALVELDVSDCKIDDAGASALLGSPLAQRLAWLDLGSNQLGEAGAAALIAAELPNLKFLNVSLNAIAAWTRKIKQSFPGARVTARMS